MDTAPEKIDRDATTPFLLKVYCRTGAFHRPDELSSSSPADLPPHVALHTWPSATLAELTQQLAAASPRLLPSPAVGTRVAFRLVYRDVRGGPDHSGPLPSAPPSAPAAAANAPPPRLATQDLGSVVIGAGGPGAELDDDEAAQQQQQQQQQQDGEAAAAASDAARTLADARFVVGDFLSVAILPPNGADGSVQPASAARTGRGYGAGQASLPTEGLPGRDYGAYGHGHRHGHGREGLGSRMGGGGGGGGGYGRDGGQVAPPVGEWRRGERLPDVPAPPSRGGGRRRW